MLTDDKRRERYLLKKYGVTLAWYNKKLEAQGGGCAICGSKPVTRSLPVDHDHKVSGGKIKVVKDRDGWAVHFSTPYMGYCCTDFKKRKDAIQFARQILKEKSARGVVCFGCNTGIRKFRDRPELLEAAAKYLRDYQEKND